MTKREVRVFMNQISPNPGYVLNLTKAELSDLVYDTTNLELEEYQGPSSGKYLADLLAKEPEATTKPLVNALLNLKEQL